MKIRVVIAAWLLTVASGYAHALGLGEILVKSRLNQPLDAEIQVREAFPGEAEALVARLASPEDYSRVGLERARMPSLMRFDTAVNDRGQTVIQVRSDDPIREPFVTLLVEVSWSGGRLLRDYGILLDPPVDTLPSVIARVDPPTTRRPAAAPPVARPAPAPSDPTPAQTQALAEEPAPRAVEPTPAPPPPVAPAPPPIEPAPVPRQPPTGFAAQPTPSTPAPALPAAPTATDDSYTVQRGDTLSGIAREYAGAAGVNVNQMMVALLRENPGAFFSDNINALKAGAVLRIPAEVDLRSAEATQEVVRQNEAWTGIRAATPALADAGAAPSRPGAATPSTPDPRLELLPPRADTESSQAAGRPGTEQGGAAVAEIQADLQRAREELRSREQEVDELASRVRDLEELNAKNARLLELKDSELAQLQQRLSQAATPAASDPVTSPGQAAQLPPAAAVADDDELAGIDDDMTGAEVDPFADDDDVFTDIDEPAADAASDDDWDAALAGEDVDPFADELDPMPADDVAPASPIDQPAPEPVVTTPPPAVADPATTTAVAPAPASTDTPWFMQPMVLGGIALGIALLLAVLLMARRRRVAVDSDPGEPKRSVADLFGDTGRPVGDAEADTAPPSVEDEAQALQFQIERNPNDDGAYLELISLYYAEGDTENFAHWAERYGGRPGVLGSAEWEQVESMGRELLPRHPLFHDGSAPSEPAADDDDDMSWLEEAAQGGQADAGDSVSDVYVPPPAPGPAPPAPEPSVRPAVQDITGTAFDEEDDFADSGPDPDAPPLDFEPVSLDADPEPPAVDRSPQVDLELEDDEPGLGPLDFGDSLGTESVERVSRDETPAGDLDGGMDEAATKLELARAYLDMGDPEGAKAMLEEVLGEGDTGQREEARKLLATL